MHKKSWGVAVIFAFACGGCSTEPTDARATSKTAIHRPPVLILSLDGLRPEFYQAASGWDAPNLKKLAALGASATAAEPIFPSLTYPNHATILTGVRSARHGISSNTIFNFTDGPTELWYWDIGYIKSPEIWQRAQAAGYKTAILTWPGTVGSHPDWLIPEIFPAPPAVNGTTWELMHANMDPLLADELVAANQGQVPDGFVPRDAWVAVAAAHILQSKQPEFTLTHLINVDHAEHESGKDSPEVHLALRAADAQIAQILAAVDLKKTTVFILGDHGFYDYDQVIKPNVLFAKQGWLHEDLSAAGPKIRKDWRVATQSGGGGVAAIYTRDPHLGPRILRLLQKNAPGHYHVIERPELDRLEAFPGALCAIDPVIATLAGPGFGIALGTRGPFIEKLAKVRGNHGPFPRDLQLMTGLIVVGPGIAPGTNLGHVRLLDVAPTIARLIHVPLTEAEGQPIALKSSP